MPTPTTKIIRIEGLDRLVRQLDKSPVLVRKLVGDAMEKSAHLIHLHTMTYPPPPPSSTYVRTGTLKKSWTSKVNRGRFEAQVGTRLNYAPYVLGDDDQAAVHRGRWKTVGQVADKVRPDIDKFFEDAGEELVRELAK